jgi:spore maturation protein A
MINYIWFGLMAIGIITGIVTGNAQAITEAALKWANTAVELSLGMIGVMTLWMGIMRIAENSGLVAKLSRALRPIMVRLFPDVPGDHPAMGAMLMNISANMLGLGDAATPFGLKAMKELQELNTTEDTATDSMCTFLVINTASVLVIPSTIIAYRVAAGSKNPAEIIGPSLVATLVSAITAVVIVKMFSRLSKYKATKPDKKVNDEKINSQLQA